MTEVTLGECVPEPDGGWRRTVFVDGVRFDLGLARAGTHWLPYRPINMRLEGVRYRAHDAWQGVARDAGGTLVWTGKVSVSCGPHRILRRAGIVPKTWQGSREP